MQSEKGEKDIFQDITKATGDVKVLNNDLEKDADLDYDYSALAKKYEAEYQLNTDIAVREMAEEYEKNKQNGILSSPRMCERNTQLSDYSISIGDMHALLAAREKKQANKKETGK